MSSGDIPNVDLVCTIGFDARRFNRVASLGVPARREAFNVITSLAVADTVFELPYAPTILPSHSEKTYTVNEGFAERLSGVMEESLLEFGTVAMDCEAFARMLLVGGGKNEFKEVNPKTRLEPGAIVRMIHSEPEEHGDHWVVGLGHKTDVIHVAGVGGRFMTSSIRAVRRVYPGRTNYILQ